VGKKHFRGFRSELNKHSFECKISGLYESKLEPLNLDFVETISPFFGTKQKKNHD
jgi:hypothetical protein